MIRVAIALVLACSCAFGQAIFTNHTGYNDTSQVAGFRADSLKYSKLFPLSEYENLRVDCMMDDTSATGYAGDSVLAVWGIQTCRLTWNASGGRDTAWSPEYVILDTFDITDAATWGPQYILMGTNGVNTIARTAIDTSSGLGYAVQSRVIAPFWDVAFRCFALGLTGNKVGSFVKTRFAVTRREHVRVR